MFSFFAVHAVLYTYSTNCYLYLYHKSSKNWDTLNNYHNCPKNGTVGIYNAVMHPKDTDAMANAVDPDQTSPVYQGLHCLLRPLCPNT